MTCTISEYATFSISDLTPEETGSLEDELRGILRNSMKQTIDDREKGSLFSRSRVGSRGR
jgi:hypothetical protein